MDSQKIIDKIKELIRKGNVSRVIVRRKGKELLNFPVSLAAAGTIVGIAAAKWAVLAALLATVGFGCTVEVIREDGGVVNVMDETRSQKMRDFAADAVEKVKENIPVNVNVDFHHDAEQSDTQEDEPLDPVVPENKD